MARRSLAGRLCHRDDGPGRGAAEPGGPAGVANRQPGQPRQSRQPSRAGGTCFRRRPHAVPAGSRVYPETGNGGLYSVHTAVHLVYDAKATGSCGQPCRSTTGATQCLTSFSLDLERKSVDAAAGPDLTVGSVTVNGRPARFRFVQPTIPAIPAAKTTAAAGATRRHSSTRSAPAGNNPLPPACTPELTSTSAGEAGFQERHAVPANKLVIIRARAIRRASASPSRSATPPARRAQRRRTGPRGLVPAPADGGFRDDGAVAARTGMPLNDYPAANPPTTSTTTVAAGRPRRHGVLDSKDRPRPDAQFRRGSVTWHWHSRAPSPVTSSRTASASTT